MTLPLWLRTVRDCANPFSEVARAAVAPVTGRRRRHRRRSATSQAESTTRRTRRKISAAGRACTAH